MMQFHNPWNSSRFRCRSPNKFSIRKSQKTWLVKQDKPGKEWEEKFKGILLLGSCHGVFSTWGTWLRKKNLRFFASGDIPHIPHLYPSGVLCRAKTWNSRIPVGPFQHNAFYDAVKDVVTLHGSQHCFINYCLINNGSSEYLYRIEKSNTIFLSLPPLLFALTLLHVAIIGG